MYTETLDVWYKKQLYLVEGIEDTDSYMWGNTGKNVDEEEGMGELVEDVMSEEFGEAF
jgi:hypothetical protein